MRRLIFDPGPAKLDPAALLELNTKSVLTAIASNPGGTAADAARATGLSASTVSRLVEDLKTRSLVLEGERIRGKRGQPGLALQMNPDGAFAAGCELGFGEGYLFIRSLGGRVLAETEFSIDESSSGHVADVVAAAFGTLRGQAGPIAGPIVGLGVAVPVDFARLFANATGQQPNVWDERVFRQQLQTMVGVPVKTYAAGSAGAWAELAAIPAPRPADYVYLFIDRFIQSGFLLDGRLWVPPQSGQGAVGRMAARAGERRRPLYDIVGLPPNAHSASGWASLAADERDRWIADASEALAQAVQSITDMLGLSLVIIDGNVPSDVLDALLRGVGAHLAGLMWANAPDIRRGRAGGRARAKGAALSPLYAELFADPAG